MLALTANLIGHEAQLKCVFAGFPKDRSIRDESENMYIWLRYIFCYRQ